MNKEERRRQEARRKLARAKRAKAAVIGSIAFVMPILFYLVLKS